MQSCTRNRKRTICVALIVFTLLLLVLPVAADANDEMEEDSIFASIRRYEGLDPADMPAIVDHVNEGFLPIVRDSEGFIAYYLLTAEDVLVAVSIFKTPEEASASNEKARDYVAENLAPLLPNPPQIAEGSLDIHVIPMLHDRQEDMEDEAAAAEDMMMDDGISTLHASLRIYEGFDLERLDETNELVETILAPIFEETEGFFSYYTLHNDEGVVLALSIYDSEENALAANDSAAAFVAEYLADWLPENPTRINGRVATAALMAMNDGANLIDEMGEDSSG